MVQEGHQKPIVSNPKKFGIGGIRGTDGQSGSTENWRRTAKVFGDVGARTTSTQDRWSYRHGCSTVTRHVIPPVDLKVIWSEIFSFILVEPVDLIGTG